MTRIFLLGYMGAGKTTLGRALAAELGLQFIDLDCYIEERFRKTISQIFAERPMFSLWITKKPNEYLLAEPM